jgi:hypothetical protein
VIFNVVTGREVWNDQGMPLSEEEQRVFAEIERQLVSVVPRRVRFRSRSSFARRHALGGPVLLLVVSLIFAGVGIGLHPALAVLGFLGVLVATTLLVDRIGETFVSPAPSDNERPD